MPESISQFLKVSFSFFFFFLCNQNTGDGVRCDWVVSESSRSVTVPTNFFFIVEEVAIGR